MASKSPEYLIAEPDENEDGHEDVLERESSLAHSIKSDLMLLLTGTGSEEEKIPLFYFHEGNA